MAAASGSVKGGTGKRCSPRTLSASRLVTSNFQAGTVVSQPGHRGSCGDHLLEVVEDDETAPILQTADELVQLRTLPRIGKPDGAGDGNEHRGGTPSGLKIDEEHPVVENIVEVGRDTERQPCLADAARPEERQEAHSAVSQELLDLFQLPLSPEEGRRFDGEVT